MRNRALLVGLVVLGMLLPVQAVVAAPASAAPAASSSGDYCVIHVTGKKASGELTTTAPRCYASRVESMTAEHVQVWGENAASRAAAMSVTTFTIGYHCDGYNLGGPCTSVVGADCTGGWLNTSVPWNNRISSTQQGCPSVGHYDGANLTGSSSWTFAMAPSWTNLTTFNNLTSSLTYT